jgi:hypothetical protein
MSHPIASLISILQSCSPLLGQLYDTPQGIFLEEGDQLHLAKLKRINAVRKAHDESYRLDTGLRRWFDKALNRRRPFGRSVDYNDILANLKTAVEDYEDALMQMSSSVIGERLNMIFELCDDFATEMTEDLEQFRLIIETNAGFNGSTLQERIRYNQNRLKRAHELQRALETARDETLLERASHSDDLSIILRKEFFSRHKDLHTRLRGVYRVRIALKNITSFLNFTVRGIGSLTASGVMRSAPRRCMTGSTKVRAMHITSMALPGRFLGFSANFSAAAAALRINGVLTRVLLLHQLALAMCLGHFLPDFGPGKGQFGTCIRCYKFSLLSKSRASSSKHGNSSNQFFDEHDSLQRLVKAGTYSEGAATGSRLALLLSASVSSLEATDANEFFVVCRMCLVPLIRPNFR